MVELLTDVERMWLPIYSDYNLMLSRSYKYAETLCLWYDDDERRFNRETYTGPPHEYGCWFDAACCAVTPPWVGLPSAEGAIRINMFSLQALHRAFWARLKVQLDELIFKKAVKNEKYYYVHTLLREVDQKKALDEAIAACNVGYHKTWEEVLLKDAAKVFSKIERHMQSCRCALCRAAMGPTYWKDIVEYPVGQVQPKSNKSQLVDTPQRLWWTRHRRGGGRTGGEL
jgi:hypothetical protein